MYCRWHRLWLKVRVLYRRRHRYPLILSRSGLVKNRRYRDGIYGNWLKEFLDECYDIRLYQTSPRCPNWNSHIERGIEPLERNY